jgi:hypothetical protein
MEEESALLREEVLSLRTQIGQVRRWIEAENGLKAGR